MKWILTLILMLPAPLLAADKFVAKDGSNANPGTIGSPYLTVGYCLSQINQTGGDICNVRTGTYNEYLYFIYGAAGTPIGTSYSNSVTIKNYNGEIVIFKANGGGRPCILCIDSFGGHQDAYWIVDGIIFDGDTVNGANSSLGGLYIDHMRIRNVEVKNNVGAGIITSGSYWELLNVNQHDSGHDTDTTHGVYMTGNYTLIDGGRYHHNTGYGIQIFNSNTNITTADGTNNAIVRNARIYDNYTGHLRPDGHGGGGIIMGTGQNNVAYNNLIYNNFGSGIDIDYRCGNPNVAPSGPPCAAYNNTIYGNEGGLAIGTHANFDISGTIAKNNIFFNTGGAINDNGMASVISNNTTLDPSFTDAANADFTIPFSSVARNNGADLTSLCTGSYISLCSDIDAKSRPSGTSWDNGAYQYASGTPPNICGVSVSSGFQSQTLSVTVTGCSTNFSNGVSVGSLSGTGITVNSTTVSSTTSLVLSLTISSTAALTARDITITTGAETATGTGVFTVMLSTARKITVHSFTR